MKPSASSSNAELCAIFLCLNEESNIAAAIESVRTQVKQVIVVDSGSSDRTQSIAENLGALVLQHREDGPFIISRQRNWALTQAQEYADWAVFLDADERATPEFLSDVFVSIGKHANRTGFCAAPAFYYQGTWLKRFMGFPNWHPRVVRSDLDSPIVGGVWERFADHVSVGYIESPYLHFANIRGLKDWIDRHLRYAEWEAQEASARDRRPLLRRAANALGLTRPFAAMMYFLIVRRGFLDGGSVWSYARRQLIYQLLILEAKREFKRDLRRLPR